jgi:hypothetical protein
LSNPIYLSKAIVNQAPASPGQTLWRGTSPGVRGWLLAKVGMLGARISSPLERGEWYAGCPHCSSVEHVILVGPPLVKPYGRGFLLCDECRKEFGPNKAYAVAPEDFMAQAYDEAADLRLARFAGYPTVEDAFGAAKVELEAALPEVIDLARPREAVVEQAAAALVRFGADEEPQSGIAVVALWVRKGKPVTKLPLWVGHEVRERVMHKRALLIIIRAVERATLSLGREWVTTAELLRLERASLEEVARLLDWGTKLRAKSIGHLLRHFEVPPGGGGPGLRQLMKRSAEGKCWQVYLPNRLPRK